MSGSPIVAILSPIVTFLILIAAFFWKICITQFCKCNTMSGSPIVAFLSPIAAFIKLESLKLEFSRVFFYE